MKAICVTIHGVRTEGKNWQDIFHAYCKVVAPGLNVVKYKYGFLLGILSYLMSWEKTLNIPPFLRGRYVGQFSKFIKKLRKDNPDVPISIVAHSFGGWLTECMIARTTVNFQNIVYVHCPISSHIEHGSYWSWLTKGRIKRVFAWSSYEDEVIGYIALPPFGQNGYWGYLRQGRSEDRTQPATQPYTKLQLFNIHTNEEHGGVLKDISKYGKELVNQVSA